MIERLFIKNYLIIKEAGIDFSDGLNILTGETGAGKSIILDALGMILGDRADFSLIRKNEDKLVIEGFFNISKNFNLKNFITEKDFSNGSDIVIIRRELLQKGISRNFINDTPVSISDLKEFGDMIVDIHSQNEHQSILKKETHITMLDSFAGLKGNLENYKNSFDKYKESVKRLNDLRSSRNEILEKRKYNEFQLKEINDVNPGAGEYEELESKLQKMENSEEISTAVSDALNILYEKDDHVIALLSRAIKELEKISKFDDEVSSVLSELNDAYVNIKDAAERLNSISSGVEFDGNEIEQIRDRLGSLSFLKKRFNLSLEEILKLSEKITEELNFADNFDFEIEKMENIISDEKDKLFISAKKLSEQRIKSLSKFEHTVNKYLKEVGLNTAEFKIKLSESKSDKDDEFSVNKNYRLSDNGIDEVEFFIRTIKGGEFTSLKKTASGGEVSRIMLSIKASLAGKDEVPILVFDEIDTGISGRIADKVGNLMKQLSEKRQIIAITHLPQIAAKSDKHFSVSKKETKNETTAEINFIEGENKVEEIAMMLSGEKVSETSKNTARELIGG